MKVKKSNSYKRLKLGRVVVAALLILISMLLFNKGDAQVKEKNNSLTVVVYPGETLWEIASNNNTKGIDIRKLIYIIKKANGLKSANIYPGQELIIPLE